MLKDTSGQSSRRVVRATMLIVVGIGVRSITNIVLIRLGFQFLGEQQFGLWVLLQSLITYLNLSDLGVGQGIMNAQAAMAEKRDRDGAIRVLSSGVAIFSVVALTVWILSNTAVSLVPGLWHSEILSHDDFQSYFILLSALGLAALPFSAFSASLGGLRDLEVRYTWDITLVIAMATTTAIMFVTKQSMLAILAAPLAIQLAWYVVAVGLVAIRHSRVTFQPRSIAKETVRGLIGSSSFIFLMSLALLTQRYSANFITGTLVSVEAVAQVHPHVVLFQIFGWALVDAATRAMLPFITGIGVRGDQAQLQKITVIAAKVSTVAAVGFSLGIWVLGSDLMKIWLKKDVFLGLPIVTLMSLIFVLDSPAAVFTNISIATERHRHRAVANLGYALSLCLGGVVGAWLAHRGHIFGGLESGLDAGVDAAENISRGVFGMFAGFFAVALIFHFLVYPRVMSRDLQIPFTTWFFGILLKPLLVFGGGIGLVLVWRSLLGETMTATGLSLVTLAVLGAGFVLFGLFDRDEKKWLAQRLKIRMWST